MTDDKYFVLTARENDSVLKLEIMSPSGDIIKHRLTPGIWEKLGYSVNDNLSEEQYAELRELSERCEAVTRAMILLSHTMYSVKALTVRLTAAGHSQAAAEYAVKLACRRGLIDERAQAEAIAERQVTKLWRGKSRVVRELLAKGYPSDTSRAAADSIPQSAYDDALDCALYKKTRGGYPEEKRGRDRIISAMVNAGFSGAEVLRKLEHLRDGDS